MKLLEIHASPRGEHSVSRLLAEQLKTALTQPPSPPWNIQSVDLDQIPITHINGLIAHAMFTPPDARTSDQKKLLEPSDRYCSDLLAADVLIISTPMWNFSVPSTLKAWIDHVVRVGVTFQYTETGPKGLLNPDLEVFLCTASGGAYSTPETHALDHVGPYLKQVFHFLGCKRVHLIPAESVAIDAQQSMVNATERLQRLLAHRARGTHEPDRSL